MLHVGLGVLSGAVWVLICFKTCSLAPAVPAFEHDNGSLSAGIVVPQGERVVVILEANVRILGCTSAMLSLIVETVGAGAASAEVVRYVLTAVP